jgi:hypothetical protein
MFRLILILLFRNILIADNYMRTNKKNHFLYDEC